MEIYIVKEGDTLDKISKMYNISKNDIVKANSLIAPYDLSVGTILNIPFSSSNIFDYYVVKKGDTLYSIAKEYNTSINTLSEINGLDFNEYIYPNQSLLIPKKDIDTYITKIGDTLDKVANNLKTTEEKLIEDNTYIYLLPEQLMIFKKS